MCPKFLASPIFYNGKWPTVLQKIEFLEIYLTFFKIQIDYKS